MGNATDAFAAMNAAVMTAFGQPVIYRPKGLSPLSTSAVVSFIHDSDEQGYSIDIARLQFDASAVPKPQNGDEVEIDGKTWTVRLDQGFDGDGTWWNVNAISSVRKKY